ncbi:hypothetical protein SELMODRAFT_418020 [Selaginella moellendorffii]|uniref:Uncharacterized protein n=1 Tax=Selaginella moellendorffii TaxID=88036 RepID=D8S4E5_SELML|nr:hypothetical protein SELMODRAFT_418020 [Selaginella moellendorffii]
MNITRIEEQNRPMVVYNSDGRGLEDHGVPPPPFLEGSSSTPLTLMELLDNFSTVDANFIMLQHEEVSALQDASTTLELLIERSINVPPSIVESIIAWFIEKRDLRRNWVDAQQLRELFDTAETLYYKFSHFCIEKAMFRPYKLVRTRLRPSHILIEGALVWEEATIKAGGPHAKTIREAVHQIPGSMRGLFVLREGAMYWHPKMPLLFQVFKCNVQVSCGCTIATGEVLDKNDRRLARGGLYEMDLKACTPHIWNALNQLRGASSLKEEGDRHKLVDSILEKSAITNYNAVLESRFTKLGEGYE